MSKHTPGPWKVGLHDGVRQALWSSDGVRIAEAFSVPFDRADQIVASAKLIAASPRMLEVLEAVASAFDLDDLSGFTDEQRGALECVRVITEGLR